MKKFFRKQQQQRNRGGSDDTNSVLQQQRYDTYYVNNNNNPDEQHSRRKSRHSRSNHNNNNHSAKGSIAAATTAEDAESGYQREHDDEDDDDEEEEVYIVRQQTAYCTVLFSLTQTIVLILMMWQCGIAPLNLNPMVGPYPDALSEWGGKNAVLILDDGELYRLITPIFLHAGIIHLLGNVLVQMDSGAFFEKEWGSFRWLLIYMTSAVGSSIFSVVAMPNAVSVGSSGAVMGLFGGKLAEVILRACERQVTKQDVVAATVRKEQCCVCTISVILVMAFSFIPFVDWAAHLGGLIAGFVVGCLIFACDIQGCVWKIIWFILGGAATAAYFVTTITYMFSGQVNAIEELRDVCGYYKENFDDYECNCMRDEYLQNNNNNAAR